MINCIIVGIGGFVGAVLRYLIGLIPASPQSGFPIKTLLINIIGAFVIGLVVALGGKKEWNPQLILFLKVGLCGGFTTFSSFALETNQLIEQGNLWGGSSVRRTECDRSGGCGLCGTVPICEIRLEMSRKC